MRTKMTQVTPKRTNETAKNYSKMSKATWDLLLKVRRIIPPLLSKFHKGQMGRVAVIGGCEDYTGAPYFSAIASARLGVDLSHVICEPQAALVIKTYSPDLIVHPLMLQSNHAGPCDSASSLAESVIKLLPRLHVLVIGPGLGRDSLMLDTCAIVIEAAKKRNMPLVLDADALTLIESNSNIIQNYTECFLTPNLVEFDRLCKSMNIETSRLGNMERSVELAKKLGGVTVIQKGAKDYISNGQKILVVDIQGGLKRSGGQGDTLTGCLATFLCWRKAYLDGLWEHEEKLDDSETLELAAFAGSAVTRECSRLAFSKRGRSVQADDLSEEIHIAFMRLFESNEPEF
ncbi:ATP-dependent H-hydrate dehydratase [Golovinomyces cichoracearum]|uniref:ATP-dependent (S)-NAD(P)H-hydrate dehydratase n=1 Tax=Golovinomyces cichoracearum TaxID=62708 RepID=A0A420IXV7_9PEZI|nr:ATP-dependent H-hydrate dehydratase [Golovinomyces cichoracearum]